LRAARTVNSELLALYWRIGRLILIRQESEPWGSGVIKRLANDLRGEFPDMKGLSPTNLQYMRAFAAAWPDTDPISQRPVGKLPWAMSARCWTRSRTPPCGTGMPNETPARSPGDRTTSPGHAARAA
jgi:uncharacterized protein DUF1016